MRCLAAVITYNDGENLRHTLGRFGPGFPHPVIVHDDGSTDGSAAAAAAMGFEVAGAAVNGGVGSSIRRVVGIARARGYEALALIPGNNKNDPAEILRLLEPIVNDEADYVQGSRFLPGGRRDRTPIFRLMMVRLHAALFSMLTGRRCTDALEGFRAYRLSIFDDPRINIGQRWLDGYEFETYLHYQVLTSGLRVREVPVSKIYPSGAWSLLNPGGRRYSHIRPVFDWWRILRPLVLLRLGIRR